MTETQTLILFTRTPLHVGADASVGVIDMPVQRERHTGIPIIPGSGLKGVLRDLWAPDEQEALFGSQASIGELLVGEARVLCFPVRSAANSFAWVTSPLALQRFARECSFDLPSSVFPSSLAGDAEVCLAPVGMEAGNGAVVLEEYSFKRHGDVPPGVLEIFKAILPDDPVWKSHPNRLVVLPDGLFSHFCANACEVQQRVCLNEGKTVENLFNQENVPAETLFFGTLAARRKPESLTKLEEKLKLKTVGHVLQIGGDETIGLGLCSAQLLPKGGVQ
jgi:CRISPR-associated protein Cmr4